MSQIPQRLIFVVVAAIASLALLGLGSLCLSMFMHYYSDPAILTAIITLTSGLIGSLTTILSNPRTHPPESQVTATITTAAAPLVPAKDEPVPVIVKNPPSDPANVNEVPKGT